MNATERVVISVSEAAALIGVRRETVYDMARRGEIPCRRIGRRFLIPRAAFLEWVNAGDEKEAAHP